MVAGIGLHFVVEELTQSVNDFRSYDAERISVLDEQQLFQDFVRIQIHVRMKLPSKREILHHERLQSPQYPLSHRNSLENNY